MYWINDSITGLRISVESFDRVIEIFDLMYYGRYEIRKDEEMLDVWWITITLPLQFTDAFMITNLQPASDLGIEK